MAKMPLGSRVNCNGLSFLVVGIYDSKWKRDVFIPFSTARMMASDKEDLRQLSVDLKDVHTEEDGNSAEEGYERPLLKTTILMKRRECSIHLNYFTNTLQIKERSCHSRHLRMGSRYSHASDRHCGNQQHHVCDSA